jgi:hypothetical protein
LREDYPKPFFGPDGSKQAVLRFVSISNRDRKTIRIRSAIYASQSIKGLRFFLFFLRRAESDIARDFRDIIVIVKL